MKKNIRQLLLWGTIVSLLPACSSSQSRLQGPDRRETGTAFTGPALASQAKPQPARLTVAVSPERSNKVESVVRRVLDAHGFVPPAIIEGQDGVRWAVSTRAGSNRELVLATVKMGAENQVSAELLLYAHIGSTWALLSPELRGVADQEAREMNDQIRERLAP
jgi:hypothetical protein